jgi:hypothetical protein
MGGRRGEPERSAAGASGVAPKWTGAGPVGYPSRREGIATMSTPPAFVRMLLLLSLGAAAGCARPVRPNYSFDTGPGGWELAGQDRAATHRGERYTHAAHSERLEVFELARPAPAEDSAAFAALDASARAPAAPGSAHQRPARPRRRRGQRHPRVLGRPARPRRRRHDHRRGLRRAQRPPSFRRAHALHRGRVDPASGLAPRHPPAQPPFSAAAALTRRYRARGASEPGPAARASTTSGTRRRSMSATTTGSSSRATKARYVSSRVTTAR